MHTLHNLFMLFSKNIFFLILFLLLIGPIVLPNVIWLLKAKRTTGTVKGIGHSTGLSLGNDSYAFIRFKALQDTVYFQGDDNDYKENDLVPVLYPANKPEEARVAAFWSLWSKTFAYCGVPFIFWIIVFFGRDIVPKGHKVLVGRKPFFKVVKLTRP